MKPLVGVGDYTKRRPCDSQLALIRDFVPSRSLHARKGQLQRNCKGRCLLRPGSFPACRLSKDTTSFLFSVTNTNFRQSGLASLVEGMLNCDSSRAARSIATMNEKLCPCGGCAPNVAASQPIPFHQLPHNTLRILAIPMPQLYSCLGWGFPFSGYFTGYLY